MNFHPHISVLKLHSDQMNTNKASIGSVAKIAPVILKIAYNSQL